jgi:hypothetical protein
MASLIAWPIACAPTGTTLLPSRLMQSTLRGTSRAVRAMPLSQCRAVQAAASGALRDIGIVHRLFWRLAAAVRPAFQAVRYTDCSHKSASRRRIELPIAPARSPRGESSAQNALRGWRQTVKVDWQMQRRFAVLSRELAQQSGAPASRNLSARPVYAFRLARLSKDAGRSLGLFQVS